MCVIVIKQAGCDFPPAEVIAQCMNANPHGFAFAWNQDGQIHTYKTMSRQEALDKYNELSRSLNPRESSLMFHARKATPGSHKVENCHCWTHGDIVFAHNGVLDIDARDDMTDSETYFRDIFCPVYDALGLNFAMQMSKAFLGSSSNKFAVMDKDGKFYLTRGKTGSFEKLTFDGYKGTFYFSNTYWQPRSTFSSALGFDPYRDPARAKGKAAPRAALPAAKAPVPVRANDGLTPAERMTLWEKQYRSLFGQTA